MCVVHGHFARRCHHRPDGGTPPIEYHGIRSCRRFFSGSCASNPQPPLRKTPIQFQPWARAYKTALDTPNVVLFTVTRLPEREDRFHWIGPLLVAHNGFYALRDNTIQINSLDDARKAQAIATYRDDARDQMLTGLGFTNLDRADSPDACLKKLAGGRVQLWLSDSLTLPAVARRNGLSGDRFKLAFAFRSLDLYIALSNDTPVSTATQWQQTLDDIKTEEIQHVELSGIANRFATMAAEIRLREFSLQQLNLNLQDEIEERKRAEATICDSEAKSLALLDALPDTVFQVDRDGRFIDFKGTPGDGFPNHAAVMGRTLSAVMPAPVAAPLMEKLQAAFSSPSPQIHEYSVEMKAGMAFYEARLVAVDQQLAVGVVRNITEKIRMDQEKIALEADLRQAHKMEAVGTLDKVLSATERAKTMVNQILAFSRSSRTCAPTRPTPWKTMAGCYPYP